MQGYTNAQTRKMLNLLSPSSVKWTEMEKLDDIFPTTRSADYLFDALEKRLGHPDNYYDTKTNGGNEANLVLQLGTNDPDRLQACVERTMNWYDNIREVNLNCGCPAIESGGASTYGASLMKDARLTGQLVQATRKGLDKIQSVSHPSPGVSVKCRIGVLESDKNMRPMEDGDYEYLTDYISNIHENGANHVILHARPAILSGLSPVKNRIVPKLDYSFVERIASEFEGKVEVTLNGGITTFSQLRSFRENYASGSSTISSHMAGRWCLRRPLDLIGVEALLKGETWESIVTSSSSSLPLIQNVLEQYIDDAIRIASRPSSSQTHKPTTAELCLPLFLITEQLKDDYDFEEDAMEDGSFAERPLLSYDDIESLYDVLRDGITEIAECSNAGKEKKKKQGGSGGMNFNRLSSSLKSLVGTKVANKWKRNRAEL
jgi:tRNA-dihydrouridine synthase